MQSLQARIDSFQKTKRVKRYPTRSSSSVVSVKWPHPPDFNANANTLAEAGFFFSPSWDDRDSVTCFLCGKELSDWDQSDDPFEIHYTKCQSSCAWAIVRCGLTEDLDNEGRFVFHNQTRLPSSKAMEKARLETFGENWWPHDGEPGHGATSVKMSQAGFVYTPQAAGDDTVTCLYCNLSLGGWEKQDDPFKEHCSRDSRSGTACPLLACSSVQPSTDPPPPRAKRGRARSTTSTASTKSRRKAKATRGKPAKASAPMLHRSPSPSQGVSSERDSVHILDAHVENTVSELHAVTEPAMDDSGHSLPDVLVSPRGAGASKGPDTSLDNPPHHPDPILSLSGLLVHERSLTLEQWIRQEISIGYERLMMDGQDQIELFKTKAAELRQCIDQL